MELPEPKITPDQCAHALGVFMFDWDGLAHALEEVTRVLLGIDELRAHIIFESIQISSLRDLLRDIGSHYLSDGQFAELAGLLIEVQKLAGVRNRLVHGRWTIMIEMKDDVPISAEWARVYTVTDKETVHTMMDIKHQKSKPIRNKYQYFPQAIHNEALKIKPIIDKLVKLSHELNVFLENATKRRPRHEQGAHTQKSKPTR